MYNGTKNKPRRIQMNKFKKIAATSLMLLTVLNTSTFACNKKLTRMANFAAKTALLTTGIYAIAVRDIAKSNALVISGQIFLTKEDFDKCETTRRLIRNNKILFTKKEIKSIEKILDDKTEGPRRSNKSVLNLEKHNQIMKEVAELYKVQMQYKMKGDMENYEICQKNINHLLKIGCELVN